MNANGVRVSFLLLLLFLLPCLPLFPLSFLPSRNICEMPTVVGFEGKAVNEMRKLLSFESLYSRALNIITPGSSDAVGKAARGAGGGAAVL